MFAVVVTGLPGSGKTTLAVPLAAQLTLPLISKDHIKELLADHLGVGPLASEYGQAAVHVMLGLAAKAPEVMLESFFWPGVSEPEILALERPLVQVHCRCDPALARARFEARLIAGQRHAVHHAMDDWDRFSQAGGLLDLPGRLVVVDTTGWPVVPQAAQRVTASLADLLG
jgi:predicted kinase